MLLDAVRTVLRGKSVVLNTYIKKTERSKINYLSYCHKKNFKKVKTNIKQGKNMKSKNQWD